MDTTSESTQLAAREQGVLQERFLTITKPSEVGRMQDSMLRWCKGKLEACEHEYTEGAEALEQARNNKWNTSRIRNMVNRQRKRVQFYEKVVAALRGGYHLVPATDDCILFAVRASDVDEKYPKRQEVHGGWEVPTIGPEILDLGEGEYTSDEITKDGPFFRRVKSGDELVDQEYWVSRDYADIEFPLTAAKPQLMEPTATAMKSLIFDEIGIVPGGSKDPWIVGRIVDPRNKERHSFMIAWYTDLELVFR